MACGCAKYSLIRLHKPGVRQQDNAAVDSTFPTDKSVGEIPRSR